MVYAPASKIGIQWVGINICLVTYYLHHYRVTYDGVDQSLSYFEWYTTKDATSTILH